MSTALDNHEMHSLLLISFPHQLLHAFSALKCYRMRERIPEQAPAIILVWSFQSTDHAPDSHFRTILDSTIREFPFVTLIFPTLRERRYELSQFRTMIHRIAWLRDRFHSFSIDAILFAHDASADRTSQVLMQSFPETNAICFGDPPGFLYPPFNPQHQRNLIKRLFWASRARGISSPSSPMLSIVAIDFYNNGSAVHGDVQVLPRSLLLETLASIQRGMDQAKKDQHVEYTKLEGNADPVNVLVLSDLSGSGLTRRSDELALYVDICKQFSSKDVRLIIKPHFGTSPEFLKKLKNCLSSYKPKILSGLAGLIPIECFPELVKKNNIISVSSSSALLSHIYEKQICHALTAKRIKQYFKADSINHMLEANQAIENRRCASVDRAPRVV